MLFQNNVHDTISTLGSLHMFEQLRSLKSFFQTAAQCDDEWFIEAVDGLTNHILALFSQIIAGKQDEHILAEVFEWMADSNRSAEEFAVDLVRDYHHVNTGNRLSTQKPFFQ